MPEAWVTVAAYLPGHPLTAEVGSQDLPRLGAQDIFVALPPNSLQVFA